VVEWRPRRARGRLSALSRAGFVTVGGGSGAAAAASNVVRAFSHAHARTLWDAWRRCSASNARARLFLCAEHDCGAKQRAVVCAVVCAVVGALLRALFRSVGGALVRALFRSVVGALLRTLFCSVGGALLRALFRSVVGALLRALFCAVGGAEQCKEPVSVGNFSAFGSSEQRSEL
jgi:hypothetical protein